jgi:hypothetical protein
MTCNNYPGSKPCSNIALLADPPAEAEVEAEAEAEQTGGGL